MNFKIIVRLISVLLVIVFYFGITFLNFNNGHNWGGDFALYIHQAKSLIEGNTALLATSNSFMVENSSVHTFSPALYPWGFPLLLAPVYYFFGMDYTAFKILEAVFLMGAFLMMFLTFNFKNRIGALYAFLFLGIIGFNLVYIKAVDNVLSGIPFLCFSYLGLYLILKLLDSSKKPSWLLSILTGFVLFFCFSIRTEGVGVFIALFVGQVHYMLRRGAFKEYAFYFVLPYLSAFVLYLLSKWILPSGFTSHFSYENLISWQTSRENLQAYWEWLDLEFFGITLVPYFMYLVLALALAGLIFNFKKDIVLVSYFIFLIVLFVVWPFHEIRYLYSIYPLLLYFFIQGLRFLVRVSRENQVVKYTGFFILGLCLTTNITKTTESTLTTLQSNQRMSYGPETAASKEMFSYIRQNSDKENIIAFFKPRVMHLYAGRRSLALFNSMEEIKHKADYYVEAKSAGHYFQIPIGGQRRSVPQYLDKVFSNHEFNIYKILKP